MGKAPRKKGKHKHGNVAQKKIIYISKPDALEKLWLTEEEFRKLVILKGFYPRRPNHVRKRNEQRRKKDKPITREHMYYSQKDINHLRQDRIYHQITKWRMFEKKLKKQIVKGNPGKIDSIFYSREHIKFDYLIKERYPTFQAALLDLDDCLTLLFLFMNMTPNKKISSEELKNVKRLALEFLTICQKGKYLRKVFLTIKGIYYQVKILGKDITWVVPYEFPQNVPDYVDFSIFKSYLQIYTTLMEFVNYKLFHMANLQYPTKGETINENSFQVKTIDIKVEKKIKKLNSQKEKEQNERIKTISFKKIVEMQKIKEKKEKKESKEGVEEEETIDIQKNESLFDGLVFYINRECPYKHCEFVIMSLGGIVTTDIENYRITHHIIDRPKLPKSYDKFKNTREWVQPQWLFDCVNVKVFIPIEKYQIGKRVPPHLSPFIDYEENPYVPEYAKELSRLKNKNNILVEEVLKPTKEETKKIEKKEKRMVEKTYHKELEAEVKGKKYSQVRDTGLDISSDEEEEPEGIEDEERKLKETLMGKSKKKLYRRKRNKKLDQMNRVASLKRKRKEYEQKRKEEKKEKKQKLFEN